MSIIPHVVDPNERPDSFIKNPPTGGQHSYCPSQIYRFRAIFNERDGDANTSISKERLVDLSANAAGEASRMPGKMYKVGRTRNHDL